MHDDSCCTQVLSKNSSNSDIVDMIHNLRNVSYNTPGICGSTPLHRAVKLNDVKMVGLLLKYGADPEIEDYESSTPVDLILIVLLAKYGVFEENDPLLGALLNYVPGYPKFSARNDVPVVFMFKDELVGNSIFKLFISYFKRKYNYDESFICKRLFRNFKILLLNLSDNEDAKKRIHDYQRIPLKPISEPEDSAPLVNKM